MRPHLALVTMIACSPHTSDPPPGVEEKPTSIVREKRCGAVKAKWRGEHDSVDNYDRFTKLEIDVDGRTKPWTQNLLELAAEARSATLFSPDCRHVLLLTSRGGPFHIIKTERMAAYLDGAQPDYVLDGVKHVSDGVVIGAGVFRGGGWVSSSEVEYVWGCCEPPITTRFKLPESALK